MKPENCYPQELKMILSESNWLEKGKETYIFQGGSNILCKQNNRKRNLSIICLQEMQ